MYLIFINLDAPRAPANPSQRYNSSSSRGTARAPLLASTFALALVSILPVDALAGVLVMVTVPPPAARLVVVVIPVARSCRRVVVAAAAAAAAPPLPLNAAPMPSFAARRTRVDGIPEDPPGCVRGAFSTLALFAAAAAASAGRDTAGRLGARGARWTTFATRASLVRAAVAYVARRRAAASASLRLRAAVRRLKADRFGASVGDLDGGAVTPGKSRRRNSRQTSSVTGVRSRPEPASVPDSTRSRTSGVSFGGRVGARWGEPTLVVGWSRRRRTIWSGTGPRSSTRSMCRRIRPTHMSWSVGTASDRAGSPSRIRLRAPEHVVNPSRGRYRDPSTWYEISATTSCRPSVVAPLLFRRRPRQAIKYARERLCAPNGRATIWTGRARFPREARRARRPHSFPSGETT